MKLGEVEDSQFKFINRHLSLLLFFQILIKTVIKIYQEIGLSDRYRGKDGSCGSCKEQIL